jgi:apolipoprotein N-acyltransferase
MKRKLFFLLLACISGGLMAASWPARGIAPLIFIAFIPLLYITDEVVGKSKPALRVLPYVYVAFVLWNLLTTYWIVYASVEGAIMAVFVNAYFMSLAWMFFTRAKKTFGNFRGYLGLILFWIAYEYLHLDWDLSWPWLQIGNVFANHPNLVQWYEVTGNLGGSLWVLLVNIFLYETFKTYKTRKLYIRSAIITSVLLIIPITISLIRYATYHEKENGINVVCVQPNIDPWGKFSSITPEYQLKHLCDLARPRLTAETDYLIFPETAIPTPMDVDSLQNSDPVKELEKLTAPYPKLKLITGVTLVKFFQSDVNLPSTASRLRYPEGWYIDDYNAALQIGQGVAYQVYYKSKLVPGPEMFPFAEVLKPLQQQLFGKLGGMIGDLGTQKERSVFTNENLHIKAAPVICYESIYGAYCGEYVLKGANFISISTNDAWWGDTPGYKQLLAYARLRAVETRRSVARSANTGISCFINQRGDISSPTRYNTDAVISGTINANNSLSFYVQHGDYIGRACLWLGLLLWVLTYFFAIRGKKNQLK